MIQNLNPDPKSPFQFFSAITPPLIFCAQGVEEQRGGQQLPPLLVRKLSFGAEETVAAAAVKPAASPDTMPGEIFQLENIVEEPLGT